MRGLTIPRRDGYRKSAWSCTPQLPEREAVANAGNGSSASYCSSPDSEEHRRIAIPTYWTLEIDCDHACGLEGGDLQGIVFQSSRVFRLKENKALATKIPVFYLSVG